MRRMSLSITNCILEVLHGILLFNKIVTDTLIIGKNCAISIEDIAGWYATRKKCFEFHHHRQFRPGYLTARRRLDSGHLRRNHCLANHFSRFDIDPPCHLAVAVYRLLRQLLWSSSIDTSFP